LISWRTEDTTGLSRAQPQRQNSRNLRHRWAEWHYSIVDISPLGWVRKLIGFYEACRLVGFDRFLHVQTWLIVASRVWRCSAGWK
jgi:hypothetical protein